MPPITRSAARRAERRMTQRLPPMGRNLAPLPSDKWSVGNMVSVSAQEWVLLRARVESSRRNEVEWKQLHLELQNTVGSLMLENRELVRTNDRLAAERDAYVDMGRIWKQLAHAPAEGQQAAARDDD